MNQLSKYILILLTNPEFLNNFRLKIIEIFKYRKKASVLCQLFSFLSLLSLYNLGQRVWRLAIFQGCYAGDG